MPIRPEMRDRYPSDWSLRSYFVRFVRARGKCEWCGIEHRAIGYWRDGKFVHLPRVLKDAGADVGHVLACSDGITIKIIRIILTTAHVFDQRPEAASLLNLAALCQKCHNTHDQAARRRGIRERAEAASPQLRLNLP